MRSLKKTYDIDDADADGLAATNDSSGATLTLDGVLTSGGTYTSADGFAHRLSILDTATQDQSDSTFTVTGTDADGRAQTEAITGPASGATVESTKYFKTVTSVAITGGDAMDTVSMGTVDEFASPTIGLDHYEQVAPAVHVNITGTINYDIQVSGYDPNDADLTDHESMNWQNDGNFGAKSADLIASLAVPGMRAMRVVSNSYTNGAEIEVNISQPAGK